jgi:hypothetical protein
MYEMHPALSFKTGCYNWQEIVQQNLERKKTNKSQAINTRDTGDLFY